MNVIEIAGTALYAAARWLEPHDVRVQRAALAVGRIVGEEELDDVQFAALVDLVIAR